MRRIIATLAVVVVMLIVGVATASLGAEAHSGHPQKKLFDDRWYQQVDGGDYQTWMTLSTSKIQLECGTSETDCGSRWSGPIQDAIADWNGQPTTVDFAVLPDFNIQYDVQIQVTDEVLGDPNLFGIATFFDASYDECFSACTIYYG